MPTPPQSEVLLRQIEARLAEVIREKLRIETAVAILKGNPAKPVPARPTSRAELLRECLLHQPDGVRIIEVPKLLAELGHESRAANPQTNWLYQDRRAKQWFEVKDGLVKLRPGFKTSPNPNLLPVSLPIPDSRNPKSSEPASPTG